MVYVISHHDAGWIEFDHDPVTDPKTGLPYNLIETPAKYITVTSRLFARLQRAAGPVLRVDFQHA